MERESLRLWTGWAAAIGAAAVATTAPVAAQEAVLGAEALAKQLANPIASLISVPLQSNWDRNIGPLEAGRRYTLNVQPVIPVRLSTDWSLINRVILPIIDQSDVFPGAGSQFGFGDTVASFFLSPKQPTAGGWIWGAGPVALLPTGTDDLLGTGRWGLGPTGVALRQAGSWTYGALANHVWSLGGSSARADVNSCSPSSPTRPAMPGASRSSRRQRMTGSAKTNRSRSRSWSARSSPLAGRPCS